MANKKLIKNTIGTDQFGIIYQDDVTGVLSPWKNKVWVFSSMGTVQYIIIAEI